MIPTAKPCVMLFQPFFQTTLKFPVVWVTQCAIYHYNHHGASFLLALQLQAMTTEMVVYHRTDPDEVTFEIKCRTGSVKVQARTIMSGDCSSCKFPKWETKNFDAAKQATDCKVHMACRHEHSFCTKCTRSFLFQIQWEINLRRNCWWRTLWW